MKYRKLARDADRWAAARRRFGDTLTLEVTTTRAGVAETNTLVYKRAGR
jgi:hypothetical protein